MSSSTSSDKAAPPEKLWPLVSWLVGHVSVDSRRLVTQSLGSSTARTDFAVLAGLDQYGPISQALLGRRLRMNLGDMVAVLKRLESLGLVIRSKDQHDCRRNAIEISSEGRVELERLERSVMSAQAELLAPLSQQDRDQLVSLLQTLVEHHRSYQRPDA